MTSEPTSGERRPIASRDLPIMQRIAAWLVRRNASANGISVAGMIAGMLAGTCLAATSYFESPWLVRGAWLAGGAFVQLRLLANLFDGMVAIGSGKASPVGELYNEVPDRVSDAATLLGLGFAAASCPTLGYLAAIAAVFTAYVRAMGKIVAGSQDFCGPMAKQQRMFLVTVCAVLMALLPIEWQPHWQSWGLPALVLAVILLGCAVTSVRRLHRAACAVGSRTP
jgi:phosphatidylglycerophosphate synthase